MEDEKVRAALAYLFGFLSGIFFLLSEKKSDFVRFHAMQATIVFGGYFVLAILLEFLPIFGAILSSLLGLLAFAAWLWLMLKAYQGERYKLPFIGDLAEVQLKRLAAKNDKN